MSDIKIVFTETANNIEMFIGNPLNRIYRLSKSENFKYETEGVKYLTYFADISDFLNDVKANSKGLHIINEVINIEVNAQSRSWDSTALKNMLHDGGFKWIMEEPYKDKPNKKPIKTINAMEDFLVDVNEKTFWLAGKEGGKQYIDFKFKKANSNAILNENIYIKAIGLYTGYGNSIQEFTKNNRAKKIKIFFSKEYTGGIGLNPVCFDEINYVLELFDKQGQHIFYFKEPVPAKTIRILIEDTYIGYDNIIGLNDVIFYGITAL